MCDKPKYRFFYEKNVKIEIRSFFFHARNARARENEGETQGKIFFILSQNKIFSKSYCKKYSNINKTNLVCLQFVHILKKKVEKKVDLSAKMVL